MLRSSETASGFSASRMPSIAAIPVEEVAVDPVVLDPVVAAAEQQDPGPDRDQRGRALLARLERRVALVEVEVVPEDVVVDDHVLLGRRELLRVERVGDDADRVVVEAALGDRHVAHVGGAEADRAAPALDVAHHRLLRLVLRRRLPDVEGAVVDVVGLGVEDPPADRVERVDAVDAGLLRDQVVHRVAVEVREEEPVGAVVARLEAVDGDLVGVVDGDAVLLLAVALEHDAAGPAPGCRSASGSASCGRRCGPPRGRRRA